MRNKNPYKRWLKYNGTLFIFTSILNSHGKLPNFTVLKQGNGDAVSKEKFALVIKLYICIIPIRKTNYCSLTHWPVGICLICTYALWEIWLISQMASDEDNWRIRNVLRHLLSGILTRVFVFKSLEFLSLNWEEAGKQRWEENVDSTQFLC